MEYAEDRDRSFHVTSWAKCLCQVHSSPLTVDGASNCPGAPVTLLSGSRLGSGRFCALLVHRQTETVLTLQLFYTAQPFV
jgi:hypothetical protein